MTVPAFLDALHPQPQERNADVIVIGAGAVGASTALYLSQLGYKVLVLEKENGPALHQSGRNSGVIHPGYNLKPGTLKARFCTEGSRRLRAYCRERNVPLYQGGILVVARTEVDCATLRELHQRARTNGVETYLVDSTEIRGIEPHAHGVAGLHAPDGASFDSSAFVRALIDDARRERVELFCNTRVVAIEEPSGRKADQVTLRTSAGTFTCRIAVNCAGLHADRLAGELAKDLRIIPFRGYYAELQPERRRLVRSHIYAAPDLTFPFLGIHLSHRTDGRVLVGPGAMLAFGREAYSFHHVQLRDLLDTITWPGFYRLLARPTFLSLVRREVTKCLFLRRISAETRSLIPELVPSDLMRSFSGNRAQVVSRRGELMDDLVVRQSDRVIHVLNAVSPGLTCSLPFGEYLAELCHSKLEHVARSGARAL